MNPTDLERLGTLQDYQIERLQEMGITDCRHLASAGMSPERRDRVSRQTDIDGPTLALGIARAKLLTLDVPGGAFVREYADEILPPDTDPVEDRDYIEIVLDDSPQEVVTWAVNAVIRDSEEDEKRQERIGNRRLARILIGVSVVILVAATVWVWGDLWPGRAGDAVTQAMQAKLQSTALAFLILAGGACALIDLVAGSGQLANRLTSSLTRRARHKVLGDESKAALFDAFATSTKARSVVLSATSRVPQVLLSIGVVVQSAISAWVGVEGAVLVVGVGLSLIFALLLLRYGWRQVRFFKEVLGPWADLVQRRWGAMEVLSGILAAAVLILWLSVVIPLLITCVATPVFDHAARLHRAAGDTFADTLQGLELAPEIKAEYLAVNMQETASVAESYRSLPAWLASSWDALARSATLATLGFCLALAVFQFAFVSKERGVALFLFLLAWFSLFIVADRLPGQLVTMLRLDSTPAMALASVVALGVIASVAGEFFLGRTSEPKRRCPHCHYPVEPEHEYCPKCGTLLTAPHVEM